MTLCRALSCSMTRIRSIPAVRNPAIGVFTAAVVMVAIKPPLSTVVSSSVCRRPAPLCAYRKTALHRALQAKEEAKRKPSPEELEQKVLQFPERAAGSTTNEMSKVTFGQAEI